METNLRHRGEVSRREEQASSLVNHRSSRIWSGSETDTHFELPELATSENTTECNVAHELGRILVSNLSQVGFPF